MDINKIRKFNRDLTVYLGVYDRNLFGLHYPMLSLRIVMEVDNQDGITASQLVDKLRFDKGYLSRLINSLSSDGLIIRKQDPHDRRLWRLFTTDQGHQLAMIINRQSNVRVKHLLNKLDKTEQLQVARSIALLQQALDKVKEEQN